MSLLLAFEEDRAGAQRLAHSLAWALDFVQCHRFPDGETRLRLPPALPPTVAMLRGLQQPDERLATLMLAAAGARELGAQRLLLACPYLAYMRQDMAFVPGEVVSQRHVGRALGSWFDAVVTVDPHLHRVASIDDVIPEGRGLALSAAEGWGRWLAARAPQALIVGPDEEAQQWVQVVAAAGGFDAAVCRKLRRGDHEVEVRWPEVSLAGRAVVLIDDVASTGHTLAQATRGARERGAVSVDVAVTHALFVGDAVQRLREAGVRHLWSSDSVPHDSNVMSLAPLLADGLQARAGRLR